MKKNYLKPEMQVIVLKQQGILMQSGPMYFEERGAKSVKSDAGFEFFEDGFDEDDLDM